MAFIMALTWALNALHIFYDISVHKLIAFPRSKSPNHGSSSVSSESFSNTRIKSKQSKWKAFIIIILTKSIRFTRITFSLVLFLWAFDCWARWKLQCVYTIHYITYYIKIFMLNRRDVWQICKFCSNTT